MGKDLTGEQMVEKYWKKMERKLLGIGGHAAEYPVRDPHLLRIFKDGYTHKGEIARSLGQPGECHRNSAQLWLLNHGRMSLCTGYALTNGKWHHHSWCSHTPSDQSWLWETTPVQWAKYFGVALSTKEACFFYLANVWRPLTAKKQKVFCHHYPADIEWFNSVIDAINAGEVT
jgi:hypothetical protein